MDRSVLVPVLPVRVRLQAVLWCECASPHIGLPIRIGRHHARQSGRLSALLVLGAFFGSGGPLGRLHLAGAPFPACAQPLAFLSAVGSSGFAPVVAAADGRWMRCELRLVALVLLKLCSGVMPASGSVKPRTAWPARRCAGSVSQAGQRICQEFVVLRSVRPHDWPRAQSGWVAREKLEMVPLDHF